MAGVEELTHTPPCLRAVAVPPHLVRESSWHASHVWLAAHVLNERRIVAVAMVTTGAAVGTVCAEILATPRAACRHADD